MGNGRDEEARERLLAYNEADCVKLEPLADIFYCQMVQRHRGGLAVSPCYATPKIPLVMKNDRPRHAVMT